MYSLSGEQAKAQSTDPNPLVYRRRLFVPTTNFFVFAKWLTSDPLLCQTLATWQAYAMQQHFLNRLTAQPLGQLFFLVNAGKLEAGL
jgi:hypothetical protein